MIIRECTREQYVDSAPTDDKFTKTFLEKADRVKLWDRAKGAFNDQNELMGVIIVSVSQRSPKIANLQLLHTFPNHRRKGVGLALCEWSFDFAVKTSRYMRVSIDPKALEFYESVGIPSMGKQKAGNHFTMCRLDGKSFHDCHFDLTDPVIAKEAGKGRGGIYGWKPPVQETANILNFF